jgi:glutamyl-Q tRNA(Asp) synthetase
MPESISNYIGRFAPSPSGPLHIGSLLSAVASYLDARANSGRWLLRIEDIDPPREQAGASQTIINSLTQHGLHWDGDVFWQSQQSSTYNTVLKQLLQNEQAYYCSCSRSQINFYGGIHPAECAYHARAADAAIRFRLEACDIKFHDRLQGEQIIAAGSIGDPVLRRRDGLYAYQLAVVLDDASQNISDIVRGADLLDATAWQIQLQKVLGYKPIRYLHLPVIVGDDGHKLSKQSFASPIDDDKAKDNLFKVLRHLNQPPPPAESDIASLLNWACEHWRPQDIPATRAISQ